MDDEEIRGIKDRLNTLYPNLYFGVYRDCPYISVWVRFSMAEDTGYMAGAGIILDKQYTPIEIPNEYFDELNKKAELAHINNKEYFWCTECSQSLPREQYEDFVMAGNYCKECAKDPAVAALIKESHKAGFYD
jgi:hypothetical protein